MSGDQKCLRKAECAECGGMRNCDIVGEHLESGDDGPVQFWTHWYILKCRGCAYVFVQTTASNSESYDWEVDENGEQHESYREQISYWPAVSKREVPTWYSDLDDDYVYMDDLRTALRELYAALDNDLHILAAVGARLAFDTTAMLLGVDERLTFEQKLECLVLKGLIGSVDIGRMEMLIEAGNASIHRGWRPATDELSTVMDVLEHFLHTALIEPARKKRLDEQAVKVKSRVPGRPPRQKRTGQEPPVSSAATTTPGPAAEEDAPNKGEKSGYGQGSA